MNKCSHGTPAGVTCLGCMPVGTRLHTLVGGYSSPDGTWAFCCECPYDSDTFKYHNGLPASVTEARCSRCGVVGTRPEVATSAAPITVTQRYSDEELYARYFPAVLAHVGLARRVGDGSLEHCGVLTAGTLTIIAIGEHRKKFPQETPRKEEGE